MYMNEIDLDTAKRAFMGNEAFYKKFLFNFAQEDLFGQFVAMNDSGDAEEAFKIGHKLKSSVGQLSFVNLFRIIEKDVNQLREGRILDAAQRTELVEAYGRVVDAINTIKDSGEKLF